MGKEIVNQAQEAQRVPQDKSKEKQAKTHINQTTKNKYKEKILKAAREKQQITCKGIPIRLTADLSAETLQARRECQDIFKAMKEKNLHQDYSTQQGPHSDLMEKLKPLQTSKT